MDGSGYPVAMPASRDEAGIYTGAAAGSTNYQDVTQPFSLACRLGGFGGFSQEDLTCYDSRSGFEAWDRVEGKEEDLSQTLCFQRTVSFSFVALHGSL